MPVVINDFEVVSEPSPAPQPDASRGSDDSSASQDKPKPNPVEHALDRLHTQALRVWAH